MECARKHEDSIGESGEMVSSHSSNLDTTKKRSHSRTNSRESSQRLIEQCICIFKFKSQNVLCT